MSSQPFSCALHEPISSGFIARGRNRPYERVVSQTLVESPRLGLFESVPFAFQFRPESFLPQRAIPKPLLDLIHIFRPKGRG